MNKEQYKSEDGSCIISEEVIASITATAATEVEGVAAMANRPADFKGLMTANGALKSVKVNNSESEIMLDVYVDLKQGAKIQETAAEIQKNVKVAVQSMTGRPVTRVNIHVCGIALTEAKNDAE